MHAVSRLALLLVAMVLGIACVRAADAPQPEGGTPTGEVVLDGTGIAKLTLVTKGAGGTVQVEAPGRSVRVPARTYTQATVACGNRQGRTWQTSRTAPLTVTAEQALVLRVGAPLTSIVEATRQGDSLLLRYRLTDRDGNSYTETNRKPGTAPTFTVRRGGPDGPVVAQGAFEYG